MLPDCSGMVQVLRQHEVAYSLQTLRSLEVPITFSFFLPCHLLSTLLVTRFRPKIFGESVDPFVKFLKWYDFCLFEESVHIILLRIRFQKDGGQS